MTRPSSTETDALISRIRQQLYAVISDIEKYMEIESILQSDAENRYTEENSLEEFLAEKFARPKQKEPEN